MFYHIPSVHLRGIMEACRSSLRQNLDETRVNYLQLMTETIEHTLRFYGCTNLFLLYKFIQQIYY